MQAKLFGTDGVRGIANQELTADLAFRIGRATAEVLRLEINRKPRILIGMDTRVSGSMLEAALTAGITSAGADVFACGVLPTPAVAYLTKEYACDAGVVVSASHNSYEFNGIKIFNQSGYKLQDDLEVQIEQIVQNYDPTQVKAQPEEVGRRIEKRNAATDYMEHLKQSLGTDLSAFKIALDCANGAAYQIAPELFRQLGAQVVTMGIEPDGYNINDGCGSTAPQRLMDLVIRESCDLGLAFDGDADRLLAVDEMGSAVDGDVIMALLAKHLKREGALLKEGVVSTVMSNLGLLEFFKEVGIENIQTPVGDRNVLEAMLEEGYSLGGEQSGHIILLAHATTGDGLVSALSLLHALKAQGERLVKAREIMRHYPQVLINVRVPNDKKAAVLDDPSILEQIKEYEDRLEGRGRIFVRPSGTEPKLRVMLEGDDKAEIERMGEFLANLISSRYGI